MSSRCSKVAQKSNFIEFGSAHEWSGIWTGPNTNLKTDNSSSINSKGSEKGSYVFKKERKDNEKKT